MVKIFGKIKRVKGTPTKNKRVLFQEWSKIFGKIKRVKGTPTKNKRCLFFRKIVFIKDNFDKMLVRTHPALKTIQEKRVAFYPFVRLLSIYKALALLLIKAYRWGKTRLCLLIFCYFSCIWFPNQDVRTINC